MKMDEPDLVSLQCGFQEFWDPSSFTCAPVRSLPGHLSDTSGYED